MGLGMLCYEMPTIFLYLVDGTEAAVEAIYAVLPMAYPA